MNFLDLTFRAGRVDCNSDSPYSDDLDMEQREFPNPKMTAEEVFAYYARTEGPSFGLEWDEVGRRIAISPFK